MLWWLRAQLQHIYSVFDGTKPIMKSMKSYSTPGDACKGKHRRRYVSEDAVAPLSNVLASVLRVKESSVKFDEHDPGLDMADFRFSTRLMLKQPGFIFVVVFHDDDRIGSNTRSSASVNSVLLKPLPYDRPSELAMIWADYKNKRCDTFPTSGTLMASCAIVRELLQNVGGIWAPAGLLPRSRGGAGKDRLGH